jgi:hypothetical protein
LLPRGHGQGLATGYKIVSTVASDSITGNWSNADSTANTGALMIYKAAAVALPSPTGFIPHRMPRRIQIALVVKDGRKVRFVNVVKDRE